MLFFEIPCIACGIGDCISVQLLTVGVCLLAADQEGTQTVKEPTCRLDCKSLSTKDYTDMLWTAVAEFPG